LPCLGEAYRLKEGFFAIYDAEDKHDAVNAYRKWAFQHPSTADDSLLADYDCVEKLARPDPELLRPSDH